MKLIFSGSEYQEICDIIKGIETEVMQIQWNMFIKNCSCVLQNVVSIGNVPLISSCSSTSFVIYTIQHD